MTVCHVSLLQGSLYLTTHALLKDPAQISLQCLCSHVIRGDTLAGKLIKGQTGFPRGAALTSWKPAHRSSAYSVFDAVTLKSLHLCPLSCVSHTRLLHHFWLQFSLSSFVCVYSGFNLFSQLNALRCWAQSSHQTLQISLCLVPRAGRLWESSDVSSPSV